MADRPDVLGEAAHLHRVAQQLEHEAGEQAGLDAMHLAITKGGRAALTRAEAAGLERGYRLGRVCAAFDVRIGMDEAYGNGSMHWDSDVEAPPAWLLDKAEKLARGDA